MPTSGIVSNSAPTTQVGLPAPWIDTPQPPAAAAGNGLVQPQPPQQASAYAPSSAVEAIASYAPLQLPPPGTAPSSAVEGQAMPVMAPLVIPAPGLHLHHAQLPARPQPADGQGIGNQFMSSPPVYAAGIPQQQFRTAHPYSQLQPTSSHHQPPS